MRLWLGKKKKKICKIYIRKILVKLVGWDNSCLHGKYGKDVARASVQLA